MRDLDCHYNSDSDNEMRLRDFYFIMVGVDLVSIILNTANHRAFNACLAFVGLSVFMYLGLTTKHEKHL